MSPVHLHAYINEQAFRFNNRATFRGGRVSTTIVATEIPTQGQLMALNGAPGN